MARFVRVLTMRAAVFATALLGLSALGCPRGASQHATTNCDVTPLFRTKCGDAGCHSGASALGGVDLASSGLEFRLLDVPARYPRLAGCPTSPELLIDSVAPDESLLLKKLNGTHSCGEPMPPTGRTPLSPEELALVECFTRSVADLAEAGE